MNKETLEAFAREAAKGIKTEQDLNEFRQMLTKVTVEHALNAELDDHLGYDKHEPSANSNSRNGTSSKTLRTEDGQFQCHSGQVLPFALAHKTRPAPQNIPLCCLVLAVFLS